MKLMASCSEGPSTRRTSIGTRDDLAKRRSLEPVGEEFFLAAGSPRRGRRFMLARRRKPAVGHPSPPQLRLRGCDLLEAGIGRRRPTVASAAAPGKVGQLIEEPRSHDIDRRPYRTGDFVTAPARGPQLAGLSLLLRSEKPPPVGLGWAAKIRHAAPHVTAGLLPPTGKPAPAPQYRPRAIRHLWAGQRTPGPRNRGGLRRLAEARSRRVPTRPA